jgi:hypothetical protein
MAVNILDTGRQLNSVKKCILPVCVRLGRNRLHIIIQGPCDLKGLCAINNPLEATHPDQRVFVLFIFLHTDESQDRFTLHLELFLRLL